MRERRRRPEFTGSMGSQILSVKISNWKRTGRANCSRLAGKADGWMLTGASHLTSQSNNKQMEVNDV